MLKLGILIDASAEVPPRVLANPHVRVLPISIQIDDKLYKDERQEAFTREFNSQYLNMRAAEVSQSVPPATDLISQFFADHIALEFDHVFGLFITSTRSPIFKNAFTTASKAINDTMAQRAQAGIKGPLFVECYDSMNAFTGYGVQVMEVLRKFEERQSAATIRDAKPVEKLVLLCGAQPAGLSRHPRQGQGRAKCRQTGSIRRQNAGRDSDCARPPRCQWRSGQGTRRASGA
jgi:fatty acid-binding protein DegV